jgi:hypothetical protein
MGSAWAFLFYYGVLSILSVDKQVLLSKEFEKLCAFKHCLRRHDGIICVTLLINYGTLINMSFYHIQISNLGEDIPLCLIN